MDPRINPFSPGAGSPPPKLAGRSALLQEAGLALDRMRRGLHTRSMVLVGLRGTGKTVMLNRIEALARQDGALTVVLEAGEERSLAELLAPALRQILYRLGLEAPSGNQTRRTLRVLRSFAGSFKLQPGLGGFDQELAVDPEAGAADSGDLAADLFSLLDAVAAAAVERQSAIVFCLDEMQLLREKEASALLAAFHRIHERRQPLILIGASLPQALGWAGRSGAGAERLVDFPELDALSSADAAEALQIPARGLGATFSPEALTRAVELSSGYPYFLQQWGYEAWNQAAGPVIEFGDIESAAPRVVERLDHSFFRLRFDRLRPREKDYLRAMASLGQPPLRSGEVAERLGVKIQSIAPVRDSLIRKGLIYSPAYGETAFTAPFYGEFLLHVYSDEPASAPDQP